ncbi:hypothetical protein GCM10027269_44320 [Kribbella endophytica]
MSAAEKARATWTQRPAGQTNAGHWTQQAAPEAGDQTSGPDPATVAGDPEPAQNQWTLSLATDPAGTTDAGAAETGAEGTAGGDEKPQLWQVPDESPTNDDFPDHWRTSDEQQATPQWGQTGEQGQWADQQTTQWQNGEQQGAPEWQGDPQQSTPEWQGSGEAQQGAGGWQGSGDAQQGAAGWQGGGDAQQGAAGWQTSGVQNEWQTDGQQGAAGWQTEGQQNDPWHGVTQTQQVGAEQSGATGWGPQQGDPQWQAGPTGPTGGGTRQKSSGGDKPGGPPKTLLIVAGAVGLVLIIVAGVFFVANRDDKKAEPEPTSSVPTTTPSGTPTAPTSAPTTPPGSQSTVRPGQSKDPKLHEGGRIASEAISFPRQRPPWSDRKRLVPQLVNSSGQYVLLQEKFDGKNSWYADAFVGSLGTSVLFNGDVKATAADLSGQLRSTLYGDIQVKFADLRNGAVKRSGKNGWYYQQSVTATNPKIVAKALTLTVAVFDLGDGTAVAYISDIPTTRPDLRTAEAQLYKGINVG